MAAKQVKVSYQSQPESGEGRDRGSRARRREARELRDEELDRDEGPRRSRRARECDTGRMSIDLPRLGLAWAQANTRFWMSTADVFGRLMLDVNDRLFSNLGSMGMGMPFASRDERDDFDDDFDDEVDDETDRDTGRRRRRSRSMMTMTEDLTNAIRDGANIVSDAADEFDRVFRETPAEQRERRAAEDERRARARRRAAERQADEADEDVRAAREERAEAARGADDTKTDE